LILTGGRHLDGLGKVDIVSSAVNYAKDREKIQFSCYIDYKKEHKNCYKLKLLDDINDKLNLEIPKSMNNNKDINAYLMRVVKKI
jgi:hypothetical protein